VRSRAAWWLLFVSSLALSLSLPRAPHRRTVSLPLPRPVPFLSSPFASLRPPSEFAARIHSPRESSSRAAAFIKRIIVGVLGGSRDG